MQWQDYIVSDNQVLLDKPIIKGTRISIELILELFSSGWTEKQILESYPSVTTESLRAVLPISGTVFSKNYIFQFQLNYVFSKRKFSKTKYNYFT